MTGLGDMIYEEEYGKECNKNTTKAVMRNDSGGSRPVEKLQKKFREDVELASGRNKKFRNSR